MIYYENGAKKMRPVHSRKEYLELRDSSKNQYLTSVLTDQRETDTDKLNDAKRHLLQMNYSCYPNPDGTLRGSTRESRTVGMDVDFSLPAQASEEEKGQLFSSIKDCILANKEKLGLLMLERSARKGYHVVFRRQENLSQEENLRWASRLLGVEYDKGAKDITRVFYTVSSKGLLYLDDAVFQDEDADSETDASNSKTDISGTYSPDFGPVLSVSGTSLGPSAADIQEYRQTLENALKEPRKGMPFRLRQVLQALKKDSGLRPTGGTRDTPPPMPRKLPPLIKLLTRNVPEYYRPALSSAVFPALAAHLHGVKFRYWDNVEHEATFMSVLVGRQSIGKGCVRKPLEYIMKDIAEKDEPMRAREAEWKRQNPPGKTKAKDPRPQDICIQILIDNLTDAVFNQRVVDVNRNGQRYIYTQVDEIEALKKVTSRGTTDEVMLLIRKAFDNSLHGQERVGADSVSGIAPLRWNWNASTTPPNMRKFFYHGVSNGTVSRLDVSTIIRNDDDDNDPVYGMYDDEFAQELKPYLERLEAASGLIECPQAHRLSLAMKEENKVMANLYESEAFLVLSYRANVIAWLKGMLLYIAHGYQWDKTIADFVQWTQQYNLWCKMLYFGQQLENELREEDEIQQTSGPRNLLEMLPEEFSTDDYQKMRTMQGKKGDGASTLRVWQTRKCIEWDEISRTYHKTERYLRRKK